jgi:hypothetical protein
MIDHEYPVCPLANDQWCHPGRRRPKPGALPLELDCIGTAAPGKWNTQLTRIDIAVLRGHPDNGTRHNLTRKGT